MQPMLMIRSAVPGMVFVNGRFAGETDGDSAVSMPVGARGTLYIELKPLQGGYLPLAKRIALSGGKAVGASLEGQTGIECVLWPGSVLDVELTPERLRPAPSRVFVREVDGLMVRLAQGDEALLELTRGEESALHHLPRGAQPPDVKLMPDGGMQFTGDSAGGRYLLALGSDLGDARLSLSGREIELLDDGSVRVLTDADDLVGHAQLTNYQYLDGIYLPGQPEALWANGGPNWPDTPEDTALAALEAALLGLQDEAGAYFTPGFQARDNQALSEAMQSDGCVKLKYPMPDGRQAVGLIRLTASNCAEVTPVVYHALPMGGSQGTWRIDQLELG